MSCFINSLDLSVGAVLESKRALRPSSGLSVQFTARDFVHKLAPVVHVERLHSTGASRLAD